MPFVSILIFTSLFSVAHNDVKTWIRWKCGAFMFLTERIFGPFILRTRIVFDLQYTHCVCHSGLWHINFEVCAKISNFVCAFKYLYFSC